MNSSDGESRGTTINLLSPAMKKLLHTLLNLLADYQQNVRLAMVLALNMRTLPTITPEDMLLEWTDNLVSYFGPGVAWENFNGWVQSKPPTAVPGEAHPDWIWEEVAGRIFFHDLINLNNNNRLNYATKQMYETVILDLLRCIWTRLNNEAAWESCEIR